MKNAMQLKSLVKNVAKESNISPQLVLQNYMLERFLVRLSLSKYRDNCVIKGGFLIASMIGLSARATMDLDATIKGMNAGINDIQKMIMDIIKINADDEIIFEFRNIGLIREDSEYGGFRVSLISNYQTLSVPLKLDITIGDKLTPREIEYDYKLLFSDKTINVLAYNIHTILAEKIETILSRSNQNTRLRDFYDVYILAKLKNEEINFEVLKSSLDTICTKRGSSNILPKYKEIIKTIINDNNMNVLWQNYQKDFDYAKNLSFETICEEVTRILTEIYN